jgi:hypothetical protein
MTQEKFNVLKFQFGKKLFNIKEWIKFGAILHLSLDTVSMIPGVKKQQVFNVLDEFQMFIGIEKLNDYIIQDAELLGYRIVRVLDKAIEKYQKKI